MQRIAMAVVIAIFTHAVSHRLSLRDLHLLRLDDPVGIAAGDNAAGRPHKQGRSQPGRDAGISECVQVMPV
jgi:hypothetical protein